MNCSRLLLFAALWSIDKGAFRYVFMAASTKETKGKNQPIVFCFKTTQFRFALKWINEKNMVQETQPKASSCAGMEILVESTY